jgi:AraC-like DNA-binding protein/mannose-6-phosphate isomerase-like protein (cupin superfamily)
MRYRNRLLPQLLSEMILFYHPFCNFIVQHIIIVEMMKPVLEHLPLEPEESFVVKSFDYPHYPTPWHFHPEYEIVLVTESTGKRFIGDSVCDFKPGDLAFIGPNLPHLYRNDPAYYTTKSQPMRARSIVIHFLEKSFGNDFLSLPETRNVKNLLLRSRRGLEVTGSTHAIVSERIHMLCTLTGLPRWLKLLEVLEILSESGELKDISRTHVVGKNEIESERMNKVFEFVVRNFTREITIREVANHVNLSQNSFSRYFSERTRKPFITFVNEVRLSNACKLLQENKRSVSEICFDSGYNNLSHFNRQFKKVYAVSPLAYARQFHK